MPIIRDCDVATCRFAVGSLSEEDLRVVRFRGTEGISRLFEFELELVSRCAELPFADVLGAPAVLAIEGADEPRFVHGIVASFEQGPVSRGFTRYWARLVPRQWTLTQRVDCRIFQDQSVPAIAECVLKDAGIPPTAYRMALDAVYPKRAYTVQYRESAWDFVSRLFEDEGIFYFFEHGAEDHVLVVGDAPAVHPAIAGDAELPLRTASNLALEAGLECVDAFRFGESVCKGVVQLRDFDFEKPRASLDARVVAGERSELAHFEYPAGHQDAAEGRRRAALRLQEERVLRAAGRGTSGVARLAPGHRFALVGHERAAFDREYTLIEVRHEGREAQALEEEAGASGERAYANEFRCIPAETPFRPARTTPRPTIQGTQTAIVVGPEGEEIYTDAHGRIKVRFHWDPRPEADDHSSCWLRVARALAGAGFGCGALPRVGQEVVVAFHEGDPDHPHVIGSVHNGDHPVPYELPAHKHVTAWKTASTPGCKSFNELRFADADGDEQIFLHAARNLDVRVRHDAYEWTGADRHEIAVGSRLERVGVDAHRTIARDCREKVARDRHLAVAGKEVKSVAGGVSLEVSGDVGQKLMQNLSLEVLGKQSVKATDMVLESLVGITLRCGASSIVLDPAGVTITGPLLTLDGALVNIATCPGTPPRAADAPVTLAPRAPDAPEEADDADPGRMAEIKGFQRETGKGKYGKRRLEPFVPAEGEDPDTTWIEIRLVDEDEEPIPGERYEIELPDGRVASGTLDMEGLAHVAGIDPGTCRITFPDLDRRTWQRA
jgi:type VI secretion system secreted protein VgrG